MFGLLATSLSIVVAYLYTIAAWRVVRTGNKACVAVALPVLLSPLIIPMTHVGLRALIAFLSFELFCKMIDYARQVRCGRNSTDRFAVYVRFLVPFPVLAVVFGQHQRRLTEPVPKRFKAHTLVKIAWAMAVFMLGFAMVDAVSRLPAARSSFLVDHTLKVLIFTFTIEALSRLLHGFERLAGFDTRPVIDSAFLAHTVAEFWVRYNNRVHAWLRHNAVDWGKDRRATEGSIIRGVFFVFLVSAVFHELMFGIATSRFDGYQFAFFMLQAPAVWVSFKLHRFIRRGGILRRVTAIGTTFIWMWATSIFFFHGVNRVFPFFYASDPWLP